MISIVYVIFGSITHQVARKYICTIPIHIINIYIFVSYALSDLKHMLTIPLLSPLKLIVLPIIVVTVSSLLIQPSLQLVWSQSNSTDTNTTNASAESTSTSSVYPPDSTPYNLTYGEWSARWWQWVISLPEAINPLTDNTGEDCAQGQNQTGPVWFLTGTFGGSVERTCTIPEGKAILFPILNFVNVRSAPTETEEDLRMTNKVQADNAALLEASVDRVPLQDLQNYRAESPSLFNITFPEGNILGIPGGSSEAVADGYWVMLQPLPVGEHTIHFRGAYVDVTAPGGNIVTETTYHLTIASPPLAATTSNATAESGGGAAANVSE
jgi:hypothetical protein